MSKYSRSGGKYTGNHTTLTPFAAQVCDLLVKIKGVNKISPGLIKAGLKSANGNRKVKISEGGKGSFILSVRDNSSIQIVYIYTSNLNGTEVQIAHELIKNNVQVSFKKEE
ncbi:MAG: DUF2103 domain-containing protein [Candidatus Paceibacterota bacterium]